MGFGQRAEAAGAVALEFLARRTATDDRARNPNPLSAHDFDAFAWPAYLRHLERSIEPLGARVRRLASPGTRSESDDAVAAAVGAILSTVGVG